MKSSVAKRRRRTKTAAFGCWCCVEYSFEEEWETCSGKLSHVEAKSGGTRESKAQTPIILLETSVAATVILYRFSGYVVFYIMIYNRHTGKNSNSPPSLPGVCCLMRT